MDLIDVVISGVDVTNDGVKTELTCPDCGSTVYSYPWYDDPIEEGGANLGEYKVCDSLDCNWFETT